MPLFHDADCLVVGVVWDVGGAVEELPDAMPTICPNHLEPVINQHGAVLVQKSNERWIGIERGRAVVFLPISSRVLGDDVSQVPIPRAGLASGQCFHQAIVSDFDDRFPLRIHLPYLRIRNCLG